MASIKSIPLDRNVFCRLASTGKLVIVKYHPLKKCFECIRDEIYHYKKEDFLEWFDLKNENNKTLSR